MPRRKHDGPGRFECFEIEDAGKLRVIIGDDQVAVVPRHSDLHRCVAGTERRDQVLLLLFVTAAALFALCEHHIFNWLSLAD